MTISSTNNRTVAATNGATTVFPFGYYFLADEDLVVLKTEISTGAVTTLVLNSGYTVTGAGVPAGGNVTISPALATGYKITVYRDPEATQETDLVANDSLPAEVVESAFDKLTMIAQRLKEVSERSLRQNDGDTATVDTELPVAQANKFLAWNGTADALVNVSVATGSVISASTSAQGIIELATQAEVNTGADAVRAVTPATLAGGTLATRVTAAEADIVDLQTALAGVNLLMNGSFVISQGGAQAPLATGSGSLGGDGNYCPVDGWYFLGSSGPTGGQFSDPESGYPYGIQVCDGAAASICFAQVMEKAACESARGKSVTLSGRVACQVAATIHYAIVEWTGTADSPTRDIVNNWASTSYIAGGFFLGSNVTVIGHGSVAVSANTYADISLTGSVSASMNNMFVMVWTTLAVTVRSLSMSFAKLEIGATATPYQPRPVAQELTAAMRWYQHSFKHNVDPGQSAGVGTGESTFPQVVAASTAKKGDQVRFPIEMRVAPTITLYNPAAANAQARNTTQAVDCSATATANITTKSFEVEYTAGAATSAGQRVGVHWKADARL